MNCETEPLSSEALLREADLRMAQALDNFFQRNRSFIHDAIMRSIVENMTPSTLAIGQACLSWIDVRPDALSTAFANQFRQHLIRPETFAKKAGDHPATLQLMDDTMLIRQLAEDKAAAYLTDALRPEMLLLFSRLLGLQQDAAGSADYTEAYGPLSVMHALSRAMDGLGINTQESTLILQCTSVPLRDTLKHTYTALNQYLSTQGVEEHTTVRALSTPASKKRVSDIGQQILAHIQSVTGQNGAPGFSGSLTPATSANSTQHSVPVAPGGGGSYGGGDATTIPTLLPGFLDSLAHWQADIPRVSGPSQPPATLVLRQLQQGASQTDAGTFDLAMLDAVANLFEFILDDPDISPHYKSQIAQLQIPALRVALVSPEFFSDDQHPARQLIDLLGLFSRHFPEHNPSHLHALTLIEAACARVLDDPDHQIEAFTQAHRTLTAWLSDESARTASELTSEVANLERIEQQELGTLLALENLNDLTSRYPAPESVLRRMEGAWVPYMASLYVSEAGEGPGWRNACLTQLQLFLSLQHPDDDEMREARLQSIPHTNTELRHGLLAQGAEPAQLKDFFSAITATQECWIRPGMGHHETRVSTFTPRLVSQEEIDSFAHRLTDGPTDDAVLLQAENLLEGDWVDFDPPYEGLSTARVAWVGVHGYLLFCDSEGEQRFSLDCDRLAAEIRAGSAHIPELSLTRKAMLRLKSRLLDSPV
ncbi:MAG: DUF1631 family protein [Thiobacillus sp.]